MPYKVISKFIDKEDNNTLYEVGDEFPKGDSQPAENRIETLLNKHPKYNKAFIVEVEHIEQVSNKFTKTDLKKLNKSEQEKLIEELNGDPNSAKNEDERITLILQLQDSEKIEDEDSKE